MRTVLIVFLTLVWSLPASAQMSTGGLSDSDKAAWENARTDNRNAPAALEELAFCAALWEDWIADLEKSGNASTMPEHLNITSAKSHSNAFNQAYERQQKQDFPEWSGKAKSLGPYITAASAVMDTRKAQRHEYFRGLSWCFREDL